MRLIVIGISLINFGTHRFIDGVNCKPFIDIALFV